MLEVHWGEAQVRWVNLARPALQALRANTSEMTSELPAGAEATDLAAPLAELAAAFDRATRSTATVLNETSRKGLLDAYKPLAERMPEAFAIEAEVQRREPLIVESLLAQVDGLEPLHVDRLAAVGLTRLANLLPATADEIATVAGIPEPAAEALVEKVAEWKRSPVVGVTADPSIARRPLELLLGRLESHHQSYERAAGGWSEPELSAKRKARRERERAFQALRAALARLGEVDRMAEIDKLPCGRRIEEIGKVLRDPATTAGGSPTDRGRPG